MVYRPWVNADFADRLEIDTSDTVLATGYIQFSKYTVFRVGRRNSKD